MMKNHLFCVGIEFKKASDPSESYAYVTAYLGAKNIDEAKTLVLKGAEETEARLIEQTNAFLAKANANKKK